MNIYLSPKILLFIQVVDNIYPASDLRCLVNQKDIF